MYSELMVYIYMKIQKYSQYMSTAMILCNTYISAHTAKETLKYNPVAIYTVVVLGMQLKAQACCMHAQPSDLSIGLEHAL